MIKHNQDVANKLVSALGMILDITRGVYSALETALSGIDDFNQDTFTLCTVAVDNGLIDIVSGLLALTMTTTPTKLRLGSDGTVLVEGQSFVSSLTLEDKSVLGPTPALTWLDMLGKTAGLASPVSAVIQDVSKVKAAAEKAKETKAPEKL